MSFFAVITAPCHIFFHFPYICVLFLFHSLLSLQSLFHLVFSFSSVDPLEVIKVVFIINLEEHVTL